MHLDLKFDILLVFSHVLYFVMVSLYENIFSVLVNFTLAYLTHKCYVELLLLLEGCVMLSLVCGN